LLDWTELREMIGLKSVPHYTTLQKAGRRLLAQRSVRRLVNDTVRRIRRRKRNVRDAAVDSTGFDAHHISRYFIWRRDNQKNKGKRPQKRHSYRRYGKLMIIVDCDACDPLGGGQRRTLARRGGT
jgi:hypothetical protein